MDNTNEGKGIRCPDCNCGHNHVVNTTPREVTYHGKTKTIIRRRRQCRYCRYTWTTVEHTESDDSPGAPDDVPTNGKYKPRDQPPNPFLS